MRRRPFSVNVNYQYDAKRYEDKSFVPETDSVAERKKNSRRKRATVSLDFAYDASKYNSKRFIPELGSQKDQKDAVVDYVDNLLLRVDSNISLQ